MVNIVARHGLDEGPEGHSATFRVGCKAIAISFGVCADEVKVPFPCRLEEIECSHQVVSHVALHPNILIKRLNDCVGLIGWSSKRLAETKREDKLSVRE